MLETRKIYCVGDSMLPTMPKRGFVTAHFFKKREDKNLKVGEIVIYHSKGFNREGKPRFWHAGNCVHRIVSLTDSYAMIKGDNRSYEEKVELKEIYGRVIP